MYLYFNNPYFLTAISSSATNSFDGTDQFESGWGRERKGSFMKRVKTKVVGKTSGKKDDEMK